ncbi:hypothetical protein CN582_05215 [Bacillus wiedmannii]|nr:hypothetical protein CN580_16590 [Bacillus wiedmannii]PEP99808.1 hypothetical protein CN582_05215 [Bacillus wiedmannii]PFY73492.1 hypothetical protein COL61_11485 [Bacillus wiedmannii]PHF04904.1 hypothetical protein COF74_27605 [Bacillus wiedmannii]
MFSLGQAKSFFLGHIPKSRPRGIPSGIEDIKKGEGAYALAIFTFKRNALPVSIKRIKEFL